MPAPSSAGWNASTRSKPSLGLGQLTQRGHDAVLDGQIGIPWYTDERAVSDFCDRAEMPVVRLAAEKPAQ